MQYFVFKIISSCGYFLENDSRFLGLDDRISFLLNTWRHRVAGMSSNALYADSAELFEKLEVATRDGVFSSRWYAREGESYLPRFILAQMNLFRTWDGISVKLFSCPL